MNDKSSHARASGRISISVAVGILVSFLFILPYFIPKLNTPIKRGEQLTRDLRMKMRTPGNLDDRIILVGMTDLEHILYGSEIESREAYQLLLQILQNMGVKAVIFDVLFEHSRPLDSALAVKLQEVPSFLSYKFLTGSIPMEDLERDIVGKNYSRISPALFDAMTTSSVEETIYDTLDQHDRFSEERYVAFSNLQDEEVLEIDRKMSSLRFRIKELSRIFFTKEYALDQVDPNAEVPEANYVVLPTELLLLNAHGLGYINVKKGEEEIIRRIPLFMKYDEKVYPHLDLVFICDYYGVGLEDLKIRFGHYIEFAPTQNGSGIKRIPIDNSGFLTLNFIEGDPFLEDSSYSLHQVLHFGRYGNSSPTKINPDLFRGAIVIVGELNPGGTDVEPIPILPAFPLAGLHATVVHMIMNNDYIRETPLWGNVLLTILAGLLAGLFFSMFEYRLGSLISILVITIYAAICHISFDRSNLFLPFLRPTLTMFLSSLALIFYILGIKESERRKVKNIFLKSVSPRIGEEILRNYDNQAIWGSKKRITVLFIDIRGFTSLAENLQASELVEALDQYYDLVSEIIFRYDGVVNKFIGDAIMALFGAPLDLQDAELLALKAAVDVQNSIQRLNDFEILKKRNRKIAVGAGIATGEAVVGTVGKKRIRIEYTALGDTVNVADRLQSLALPGEIYINEHAYLSIKDSNDSFLKEKKISFKPLSSVTLKGKEKSIEIFLVNYEKS